VVEVIRRGEVWVGNLNPARGKEVGKVRPVLVIQADALTQVRRGRAGDCRPYLVSRHKKGVFADWRETALWELGFTDGSTNGAEGASAVLPTLAPAAWESFGLHSPGRAGLPH
jgi:hypothetical protein